MPGWALVKDEALREVPELRERVWIYDRDLDCFNRIALREVRSEKIEYQYPVLILPGMTSHGEQLIHASWHGIQPLPLHQMAPDVPIPIYLARRGFLVYTIDYRTHFVMPDTNDLSFMLDWGWDVWLGDIKVAVEKVKELSAKDKLVLMGESFGGLASINYTTVYPEDVKAIVFLDGAPIKEQAPRVISVSSIDELRARRLYAIQSLIGPEFAGGLANPVWLKALYNPSLPSPNPNFKTLADYLLDTMYRAGLANPYSYPYTPREVAFVIMATFDPYWPTRLLVEPTDRFRAKYESIKVPTLAFVSEFGTRVFDSDLLGRIGTKVIILRGYGHLDVYANPNNVKDVNEPTYNWLLSLS